MASAQVLRKQEHLEAGKKKLEEFRKKRAADRAKKTTSTNQIHASDGGLERQTLDTERIRPDSDRAGTSNAVATPASELSGVDKKYDFQENDIVRKTNFGSSNYASAGSTFAANNFDVEFNTSEVHYGNDISKLSMPENDSNHSQKKGENDRDVGSFAFEIASDHSADNTLLPPFSNSGRVTSNSDYDGLHKTVPRFNEIFPKDLAAVNSSASYIGNISPENSARTHVLEKTGLTDRWASGLTSALHKDSLSPVASLTDFSSQVGQKDVALQHNYPVVPDTGYNQFSGSATYMTNTSTPLTSDGFSFDGQSSSNYAQVSPPTTGFGARRSRPSFLDSISISRVSATSPPIETVNTDTFSSKVHPLDNLGSSNSESLMNSTAVSGNGSDTFKYAVAKSMETNHDFYSQKQNEDFAALEQHIEDLTQEKFSLQRSLEASRALAESLAAENSALTDSYNQQGGVVNQLKADMEALQGEIKANLAELEAVKAEYANVQLECNAADERSKLLASEVIGLEEKALRLRSNELKLEKELEKTQAEVSSFKKKIVSLEKERQDLQSTVDALQEEKKLLLSKLRKASTGGMFGDTSRTSPNKIDVSTSTEDLDDNEGLVTSVDDPNPGAQTTATSTESSDFPHLLDGGQLRFEGSALTIPPDQIRMIQNINTLISELSLEKTELMKAFSAESSECSKLKELNKELTRKLEAQTQRLELLTAQSMAADNIPVRQPDRPFHENTTYADEGDEVVERVLGWIMKLFPGGPSKRRTSKLL
ncbi:PREDICTED: uncharacterized protein LOC109162112 [Ipomoea nil]|uniref:uncharacterized protein LOC109162112 n=1 Tax=Ipomoea nil TaxID=35883 RepID=UPI000900F66D|nr:PREDICTED: uncharacterized protein LOC109162112 [Ipomoea nil]XP_019166351.1 PREDICTED: uncharacterized protein LOC109162112 [Ipomoea nil]